MARSNEHCGLNSSREVHTMNPIWSSDSFSLINKKEQPGPVKRRLAFVLGAPVPWQMNWRHQIGGRKFSWWRIIAAMWLTGEQLAVLDLRSTRSAVRRLPFSVRVGTLGTDSGPLSTGAAIWQTIHHSYVTGTRRVNVFQDFESTSLTRRRKSNLP